MAAPPLPRARRGHLGTAASALVLRGANVARGWATVALGCAGLLLSTVPARAGGVGAYLLEEDGRIRDARVADVDGDGRAEVALLVEGEDGRWRLVVHRLATGRVPRTFFPPAGRLVVPLDGDLAEAGGLAFGPLGAGLLRAYGPHGPRDVGPDGTVGDVDGASGGSLLARSAGAAPWFWDGLGDLDGDGRAETWSPTAGADGRLVVQTGDGRRVALDLVPSHRASSSVGALLERITAVPTLTAADLDGDGRRELVTVHDGALVAFDPTAREAEAAGQVVLRLPLPFLEPSAPEDPATLRTPRLQLEDVDGDGAADLLVTLVAGRTDRLGSLKTILFHYPGPLRAPGRTSLGSPRARIDTPSVVLHPVFVDLDGDGRREYVGDSIRDANLLSLAARMMGKDPPLTIEAFRFDPAAGTFEGTPLLRLERTYPSSEALGNTFRANAFVGADLDGDGRQDLVDLGALREVTVLAAGPREGGGPGAPWAFARTLVGPLPVKAALEPAARFGDLDGDGARDVVLFGGRWLYLLVGGQGP